MLKLFDPRPKRRRAEELLGASIPASTMTAIVDKLERLSIIKDYEFLDPVYKRASLKLKADRQRMA
ncbi:MAG: hypothetical protein JZD41_05785 [Thermoproteus sp.]|nr:hypothetical protein [Thermoproteus sp.]